MNKKIFYNEEARRLLVRGMSILVEAVAVTLGPKGRNVVLDRNYGSPQIIKIYSELNIFFAELNEIMNNFMQENSIQIILDKKNIVMANNKNDISKDILKLINIK